MVERILVIGAGIAGLCTALALGPTGRSVTLLERDDAPPAGDADAAFRGWNRRGVSHLRQSHAFLARLGKIIKQDHPALREELLAFGVRELGFAGMLSPTQRATYRPLPVDAEFTILTSRRTTLELVIRRYVERLPNVTIKSNMVVRALLTEKDASGALRVLGISGRDASGAVELHADLVVDAGGKNGKAVERLIAEGAEIKEEGESAGILYFTRHYRLKPGKTEPLREGNPPFAGDLGYLKFGVFPADNGCFSITLCTPEIEYELRKAIVRPEMWDKMVALLPGLKIWTDAEQAEPVSKVSGMGNLHSRWRDLAADDAPAVLGFFAVGDTMIRTNPLYGRGCSFAAVEAYILRDVLNETTDPKARILAYCKRLHEELRPYYLAMRREDRSAIKRAERALTPGYRPSLRSRILRSFVEDAVIPALRLDTNLLRERMRGFHMLEHPDAWLRRPKNFIRIMLYWARGKKKNAVAYPPKAGPEREAMLRALGLSHEADIAVLAERRRKTQTQKIAA
jgi:2-polyprenyl-6-methoxyphenol hydroxylase-like FAD-dependent oxidoreductase